ncbi:MAG TPA: hypothetical protein VIO32_11100 [Candidatus Baltobacteraceae bacterium]
MRTWFGTAILVALLAGEAAPSSAQTAPTIDTNWNTTPVVKLVLTPNYTSGYGPVKAIFGAQPTPAPAGGACLQGCAIDFGTVLAGTDYLYKYAAHLNIKTNDGNGVNVYGEGAADFYNQNDATSQSLSTTLYYLPSVLSGDTNTGFSASLPFYKTSGTVSGNSFATAPTITYATYPSPMTATSSANTSDLYYDYQLKVPPAATTGAYYVWVVYTVVPK